jgi:hypothetical protein
LSCLKLDPTMQSISLLARLMVLTEANMSGQKESYFKTQEK